MKKQLRLNLQYCDAFIKKCDEAITKETPEQANDIIDELTTIVNSIPHKSTAPEEGFFTKAADKLGLGREKRTHVQDSTSSDFDDGTVYSQFFESTDMLPKSDTSYFLKSDSDRIDDMMKILDSM